MATGLGFGLKEPGRVLPTREQASSISRRKLYLVGAAVQAELQGFIRGNCLQEEIDGLAETLERWKKARAHFRSREATEAYLPEKARVSDTEAELDPFLDQLRKDPLFERSYVEAPFQIRKVELQNLVACQRQVDLNFVDTLKEHLTAPLTLEQLARFCLLPSIPPPFPKCQQLAQNVHRAYALLSSGISDAYLVVRHVTDPGLEFPPQLVGLPREYLLGNPRPAVVGDFLNPALVQEFECTVGVRSIQLAWNANQTQVPI